MSNTKRLAFLLCAFAIIFTTGCATPMAVSPQKEVSLREDLVGMWEEVSPSSNLVLFAKDGSWKLYLKKGEISDFRSLNGEWTLSYDRKLTIKFTMMGQTKTMSAKLSFDSDEMVLTDNEGIETRHRRHNGPIPKRFQW